MNISIICHVLIAYNLVDNLYFRQKNISIRNIPDWGIFFFLGGKIIMSELVVTEPIKIEDLIFEIRGKQVMLASDVAKLYNSETRIINQIVSRNINSFPDEFGFQSTEEEVLSLRSHNVISKIGKEVSRGGTRYLPYVLTEQGIMMLSGLLKNELAAKINVQIINAFVAMRKYISNSLLEQQWVNNLVYEHDNQIKYLKESFEKLQEKTKLNTIFFEGQIYDAYSLLMDILSNAKKEIIIIDNYAGKELLDILKEVEVDIKIFSANMNNTLIKKYQGQYCNVQLFYNDTFHDRFIIIDETILYHCGSSFKDLGKKCFAINKIEDTNLVEEILKRVHK